MIFHIMLHTLGSGVAACTQDTPPHPVGRLRGGLGLAKEIERIALEQILHASDLDLA